MKRSTRQKRASKHELIIEVAQRLAITSMGKGILGRVAGATAGQLRSCAKKYVDMRLAEIRRAA